MSVSNIERLRRRSPESRLRIDSISLEEFRSGIPLKDFESLAQALERYSRGVGEASKATHYDYLRTVSTNGSRLLFTPEFCQSSEVSAHGKVSFSSDPLIDKTVRDAQMAYNNLKSRFFLGFENVGQGRFRKTTVEIDFDRCSERPLILYLGAAYSGKKVEQELAEALKIERCVGSLKLRAELPRMADQDLSVPFEKRKTYRLDCVPVASIVNSVIQEHGYSGMEYSAKEIANLLMQKTNTNEDDGHVEVDLLQDLSFTLKIDGYGRRFVYLDRNTRGWENLVDTRRRVKSTLILPYPTSQYINEPVVVYGDSPSGGKNYTLTATIKRTTKLPIHDQTQLEKARAIANLLKEQFGKHISL